VSAHDPAPSNIAAVNDAAPVVAPDADVVVAPVLALAVDPVDPDDPPLPHAATAIALVPAAPRKLSIWRRFIRDGIGGSVLVSYFARSIGRRDKNRARAW
jgi:hypothetical protein